jgi:hypothetical protein
MPLLPASDQVLALAPDAQIAGAARGLARPNKWSSLGLSDEAVWGECAGSGARPYQVAAVLNNLSFHCSCPSRKRPCKHALALLLLSTDQPTAFPIAAPPGWVSERLAASARHPSKPEATTRRRASASTAQSAARREARVTAGLDELALWLGDLMRRGLATAQAQPPRFWDGMAARLVDAQAPGAARLVRRLGALVASGAGWPDRLAGALGQLHLLVEGYRRIESLPAAVQADVRAALGFTLNHDALLAEDGVRDRWRVLGRRVEEEDHLRVQRVWLRGDAHGQPALMLSFAPAGQSLDTRLAPGTLLEAELVFFPSAYPLRVLLKFAGPARALDRLAGGATLAEAAAAYGGALACQPWLERFPAVLEAVRPVRVDGGWWLRDAAGAGWPLAPGFGAAWVLLALSGGRPLPVFGEWDGEHFWPLSAWADGRLVLLEK